MTEEQIFNPLNNTTISLKGKLCNTTFGVEHLYLAHELRETQITKVILTKTGTMNIITKDYLQPITETSPKRIAQFIQAHNIKHPSELVGKKVNAYHYKQELAYIERK